MGGVVGGRLAARRPPGGGRAGPVAVNDDVRRNPALLNEDPYGKGWLVRLRPSNWEADAALLVTGPAGLEAYRALLEREGIRCGARSV